jgi:tripartite-type tricarboxylate transporter receptor subunit TctC
MPDIRKSFAEQGADIKGGTPAWYDAFMREESARWGEVIKQAGIKPE